MKTTKIIITVLAVLVCVAHVVFPDIKIDSIVISLLVIAIFPWVGFLIRDIELPGGIKITLKDVRNIEKRIEKNGLFPSSLPSGTENRIIYSFEAFAGGDPNKLLAFLRMEIEGRLKDIARSRQIAIDQGSSIRVVLRELLNRNVINTGEKSVMEDILPILNKAVHGEAMNDEVAREAFGVGIKILQALDERKGEYSIPQLLEKWRKRDGSAFLSVGHEMTKAFLKSPNTFLNLMKDNPDVFNTWLERFGNFFTTYQASDEVDKELYGAYYEKLKLLMEQTAKKSLGTKCKNEAKRILGALSTIKIHHIW